MKDHPILFSGEMVNAILAGCKTQTRRVLKHQPPFGKYDINVVQLDCRDVWLFTMRYEWLYSTPFTGLIRCPYGKVGDLLWVRETWCVVHDPYSGFTIHYKGSEHKPGVPVKAQNMGDWLDKNKYSGYLKWRPSIYMPRWASRITLKITEIRIEQVQDISGRDACAEGITPTYPPGQIRKFSQLWDSVNGKRGYGFLENPWVWVVEFSVVEVRE